jgi:hypothetical protein
MDERGFARWSFAGRRPRVLLGVAACVGALLVMLVPGSAWALSRGPKVSKVSASFVAVGSEVDAGGTDGWL